SKASVSVCDRAEGSRTCGGLIVWRQGWLSVGRLNWMVTGMAGGYRRETRIDRTSLFVNVWKAAGRVVAQLDGDWGGCWPLSPRPRSRNVSVCERAEGSRTCGGSFGWRR
ncbi:uncharacterized protein N7515_009600, partial [Penicillium bovifimosum]